MRPYTNSAGHPVAARRSSIDRRVRADRHLHAVGGDVQDDVLSFPDQPHHIDHPAARSRADGGLDPGSAVGRIGDTATAGQHCCLSAAAADRLMGSLFAVGLSLLACVEVADEPVRSRLGVAVGNLDDVIGELRAGVMSVEARRPATPQVVDASFSDVGSVLEAIHRAARDLDGLVPSEALSGSQTMDILEAVYAAHGAVKAIERAWPAVQAARADAHPSRDGGRW